MFEPSSMQISLLWRRRLAFPRWPLQANLMPGGQYVTRDLCFFLEIPLFARDGRWLYQNPSPN